MTVRIISWNVNGIRAVNSKEKKKIQGITFADWVIKEDADIVCVQETKAHPEQLTGDNSNLISLGNYHSYFSSAEKKGYSGVAVYSKTEPIDVMHEIGSSELDNEGRTLILDFGSFVLFNIYYPNGQGSPARLKYKMDFYDVFLKRAEEFKNDGKTVVVCGDVNTAHKEIDLTHPKANSEKSGFLPVERDWVDKFINSGFVDTFRKFNAEPENYTWWDQRAFIIVCSKCNLHDNRRRTPVEVRLNEPCPECGGEKKKSTARDRNVGWRIDYFFIDSESVGKLSDAFIMPEVMGSDHCPLGIDLKDD